MKRIFGLMDKPRQKSFSKKLLPLYRRIKLPSQPLSSSSPSSYDNYHKSKNDLLLKRNNQYEAQNKFLSLTQTWTFEKHQKQIKENGQKEKERHFLLLKQKLDQEKQIPIIKRQKEIERWIENHELTQHTLSLMRQAGVIPGVTYNVKSNSTPIIKKRNYDERIKVISNIEDISRIHQSQHENYNMVIQLNLRNKNISSSILLQKCFFDSTSLSPPIYSQYTQRIDLRNNPLGDQGAKIIAHQVILSGNFQVLEDLNLKSCNIRNSGIKALVSVLSYNEEKQKLVPKLKRVNAKDNRPNPNFLQQLFYNRTIPQCLQL